MAGHSKWANIQHRKGAQDKKKGKLYAKLAKEITVAAKISGDVDSNPRLRLAITTAKGNSMPKDNIERAIKKGIGGNNDSSNYENIRYEGYGVEGIAFIIECLTDNKNRSASEVRSTFSKHGGNLGETGSVSFNFNQLGEILLSTDIVDEETIFETVIEIGGENVETTNDIHTVTCKVENLNIVSKYLVEKFGEIKSAQIVWKSQNVIDLDLESTQKILKLIDALEDLEDVQNVYTNINISD